MHDDKFWGNTPIWFRPKLVNGERKWEDDDLIKWFNEGKFYIRPMKLHYKEGYNGFSLIFTPLPDDEFINQIDWM